MRQTSQRSKCSYGKLMPYLSCDLVRIIFFLQVLVGWEPVVKYFHDSMEKSQCRALLVLVILVHVSLSITIPRWGLKVKIRIPSKFNFRFDTIRISCTTSGAGGQSLQSKFLRLNGRYPVKTAIGAGAVIYCTGDIIAQAIERRSKPKPFDWGRLAGTTLEESLIGGGVGCLWYRSLDKIVSCRFGFVPGTAKFVLAKLGLEFLVWQPLSLVAFWTVVGLAEGHSGPQILKELRTDFFPTLFGECCLWMPIDLLNFSRVPVSYQVRQLAENLIYTPISAVCAHDARS